MTTPTPPLSLSLLVLITCPFISACSKKTAEEPKASFPFAQARFSDVTPTADGSAYVSDGDSRLWYVQRNQAVRVRLPDPSKELPKSFDIVPVLDGSAYLIDTDGDQGLWHLIREHAERVGEVGALVSSHQPVDISEKAFYALYLAEHKKRKQMQDLIENPPEQDDSGDDGRY